MGSEVWQGSGRSKGGVSIRPDFYYWRHERKVMMNRHTADAVITGLILFFMCLVVLGGMGVYHYFESKNIEACAQAGKEWVNNECVND
jgi:hypothetical protein